MAKQLIFFFIFFTATAFLFPKAVLSNDFSSSSFKVRDPVISINSATSSSGSFRLFSSTGQLGIATSTSSTFGVRGGFLYFPFVTTPVVSATAGDAKVDLSWTSATAGVGWSISAYSVGQSTTSGGPYTNTNVGNVLSSSITGLTNGTTYYFIIRVLDAFSNSIATSTQVSAAPVTAPAPTPAPAPSGGGGGGGGGGGAYIAPSGSGTVVFTGRAYPKSTVTLLKDAQVAASTIAGIDSNFAITLSNLSAGNFIFSIYGEDKDGIRSSLFTFSVSVTAGVTTNVGGIFIAPTIAVDKSEVKKGDNIIVFGQTANQSEVTIMINSDEEYFAKVKADQGGIYLYNFDSSPLDYGDHNAKSKSALSGSISSFSAAVPFKVGTRNVLAPKFVAQKVLKGDVSSDGRVNLVDFSIVAYWYKRFSPPLKVDLNGDGKVDLVDFSIMAFYWTG